MTCIRCSFKITKDSLPKANEKVDKDVCMNCRPKVRTNIAVKLYEVETLDLVLEVLWYTGINFPLNKIKSACELVLRRIISMVYVFGIIYSFSVRMCAFVAYNSGTMIITELLAFICSICLWISINLKKQRIIDLKDSFYDFQMKTEEYVKYFKRKAYQIKCLCLLTIMLPMFSGAVSMLISKIKLENIDNYLSFLAFGFKLNVGFYHKYIILFLLRSYDLSICFISSQISCLLLSVLCYNVSCYIKESRSQLISDVHKRSLLTGTFVTKYRKVKKVVRDLEKAVSMPMFFAMAFLLCELFALMSNSVSIVRNKASLSSLVIVLCAFLSTGFYVIFIIFRASYVEEIHKSLARSFIELPEENATYSRELLNIMKFVAFQDTLQITAWGMFPIKRGFFLTIVGTLATYGVLLVQFT